ncbi:MAG: alkaline phosphatase family protein [Blastocatellia bacterium]|nr:alkaline phosphatase family protein [Blastocatellia bacterium]
MKKTFQALCALALALVILSVGLAYQANRNVRPSQSANNNARPKLVVVVVMDQFRAEYLTRFAPFFGEGGFKWLQRHGANLTNAHYTYATTYTGPGHALILSGSYGHTNGIIANKWYNYKSGQSEAMFYDADAKLIGLETSAGDDVSPRNFIGNNLSDQLLLSNNFKSKAIAVSLKDRAAIMLGGKLGKAYWFHEEAGGFLSSTYYMKDLPDWVKAFNARKLPDSYYGRQWEKSLPEAAYSISTADDVPTETDFKGLGRTFPHTLKDKSGKPATAFYEAFTATPFGTDYELEFARTVIEQEKLGADQYTDLLGISITATDIAGHSFGPDSQEVQDLMARTDRQLADFFAYLSRKFKSGEVLIAFTADHGATPMPEYLRSLGIDAGRIRKKQLGDAVEQALDAEFGDAKWVVGLEDPSIFLNRAAIAEKKLDRARVERAAGEAILSINGVAGYFTYTQMLEGRLPPSQLARFFEKSFHPERSGDILVVTRPFYFWGKYGERDEGSTHGSPYEYDTHVPLIIVGPSVRPGTYNFSADIADIAPTLATILGLGAPSGNEGRTLHEILSASE